MKQRLRAAAAFTMVEMLVVIAIIAILVAIIVPVYNNAQQKALQTSCFANLHSVALALKQYKEEYRQYPPVALGGAVAGLPDDAGTNAMSGANYNVSTAQRRTRVNALLTYLDDKHMLVCPDEKGNTVLASSTINGGDPEDVLNPDGPDGTASTYDDFYNAFGYSASGAKGPGTPILDPASADSGNQFPNGRRGKCLANRYAPGDTVVTYCREHEEFYGEPANPGDSTSARDLFVTLSGKTYSKPRDQFNWVSQE